MPSSAAKSSSSDNSPQPVGPTAVSLAMLTSVLWGGTPVAIRFCVETLPPVAVACIRFALGAVMMTVWCRLEGIPIRLQKQERRWIAVGGGMLFVQISLFNWGVQASNASHGSLLINTFIFWVVVIEHFLTKTDQLSARRVVGLTVAAASAALVLLNSQMNAPQGEFAQDQAFESPTLFGDFLLMTSAAVLGAKIVFTKFAVRSVSSSRFVLWHDVVGVTLFALYSAAFEDFSKATFPVQTVLGLLYQGVLVAGVCFAIQAMLLRRHSASQIAVFSFTTPLFGVAFAAIFRGERLSPWLFVAGAFVAVGILLVNWRPGAVVSE